MTRMIFISIFTAFCIGLLAPACSLTEEKSDIGGYSIPKRKLNRVIVVFKMQIDTFNFDDERIIRIMLDGFYVANSIADKRDKLLVILSNKNEDLTFLQVWKKDFDNFIELEIPVIEFQKQVYVQKFINKEIKITGISKDKTYGYSPLNPIKVGGFMAGRGPGNSKKYLDQLRGSPYEPVIYKRIGTCCRFRTIVGYGTLDRYQVFHKGVTKKIILYIDTYESDTLLTPMGFYY
ncbi:MAG: hypothetical protein GY754_16435 [bacterium]|nr:hypothetical protein [bacterium]